MPLSKYDINQAAHRIVESCNEILDNSPSDVVQIVKEILEEAQWIEEGSK